MTKVEFGLNGNWSVQEKVSGTFSNYYQYVKSSKCREKIMKMSLRENSVCRYYYFLCIRFDFELSFLKCI
jgi:hypothetical protein